MPGSFTYITMLSALIVSAGLTSAQAADLSGSEVSASTCLALSGSYLQEKASSPTTLSLHARQLGRFGHYYCFQKKDFAAGIHQYKRALHMAAPARYAQADDMQTVRIYAIRAKFKPAQSCSSCDCLHAMQDYMKLSQTAHTAPKRALATHYRNGIYYCAMRLDYAKGVARFEKAIALIKAHPAPLTNTQVVAQNEN